MSCRNFAVHVYCAVGIAHQTGSLTAIGCEWANVRRITIIQIGQEIISPTLLDILVCFLLKTNSAAFCGISTWFSIFAYQGSYR